MNWKMIGMLILTVFTLASIAIGVYYVKRRINYSMGYSDMVEGTVRRMVKQECLK